MGRAPQQKPRVLVRSFSKNDAPALKNIIVEASVGTYDGVERGQSWSVVSTNGRKCLCCSQHLLFGFNYAVVPEDGSGDSEKCLVLK